MASRFMLTAQQMIDRYGRIELSLITQTNGTRVCFATQHTLETGGIESACATLRLPDNCPDTTNIKTLVLSGIAESIYVYKLDGYENSVSYLFTRLDNHPWVGTLSKEY